MRATLNFLATGLAFSVLSGVAQAEGLSNDDRPGNTKDYAPPWEHGFDVCFSTESKVPTYWKDGVYGKYGTHYWTGPGERIPASKISGDDSKLIMELDSQSSVHPLSSGNF